VSARTDPLLRVVPERTEELSADEWDAAMKSLVADEQVIEAGLATFIEVGDALGRIRDARTYLIDGWATFEGYCQQRWGLSLRRANQLINASDAAVAVGKIFPTAVTTESHAAALAPIVRDQGPERAAAVLQQVASEGKITAKAIREAAAPEPSEAPEVITVGAGTGEIIGTAPTVEEYVSTDADYRAEDVVRERDEYRADAELRSTALVHLVDGLESGFGIAVDDVHDAPSILAALAEIRDEAQDRIEAARRDAREAATRADVAGRDRGDVYGLGREAGREAGRAEVLALVDAAQSRAIDGHGLSRRGMAHLCGALDAIADRHEGDA
jgi:hypothetical protein